MLRKDPSTSVPTLHQIIKYKYGYKVHYKRVWEAKRKAIITVFGDWDASYFLLRKWLNVFQATNPGTKVVWKMTPLGNFNGNVKFRRLFCAFRATIEGFQPCKPINQIDGTFLYGKYTGKLLITTSINGDGHFFPISFALVEEETIDSRSWFLSTIRSHVTQRDGVCIIYDCHAGIKATLQNAKVGWTPPHGHHRYCLRHVTSNFNEKFRNKVLKDLVYKAGSQHL